MGPLTGTAHMRLPVRVEEDTGAARRSVALMAAGVTGIRHGTPEIVVTELATNILRHAGGDGYLLGRAGPDWLEVIAADRGPGLRPGDMPPQAADGGPLPPLPRPPGSLGVGLAAVRRLASHVDWYASAAGSVVLARFGTPPPAWPPLARWGGVNVPLGGAGISGDGWAVSAGGCLGAVVVDGLGHGPAAGAAATAALAALTGPGGPPSADPGELVRLAHEAMRGTRGGVLAAAVIDPDRGELRYAGVGNIAGRVVAGSRSRGLVSREGTLGASLPVASPHVTALPWAPGSVLALATDGIRSRWDPSAYPGLLSHDPSVIAAVIYRDHERGTDDATVAVVRDARHEAR